MPGVEAKASVRDGHVVVVLRGDLDVTGAADAEAAMTGPGGARSEPGHRHVGALPPEALPLAAACGTRSTPWEGSAIAYWYRVIAAGAAAALTGSVPSRVCG